jgi:zinc protease
MNAKLLIAASMLIGATAASAAVFPFHYRVETLVNGLKVIMIPMPSDRLVAYYSVVRTGSRDEVEPGHSGFAHFFEHMMFRGTEKYPAAVYDRIITSIGADANAYTTDDYTCFHLNFASVDLPTVIDIEADRFENLAYAEREFQTEAGAVYGEYRKGRTSPVWVLSEALRDTAFDAHTYKHTTIGFEKDVAAMPTMYDYSRSFFARYYRPENVVIVIAGDFDPETAMKVITERYGNWKPGYVAPEIPVEPEQRGPRSVNVEYEGRTLPLLAIAWKGAAFDPADRNVVAGWLLGDLAFGRTSDLYREIVLDTRIAQRLTSDFGFTRDPGLWTVLAVASDAESVQAIEQAVAATVARFRSTPADAASLEAVKKNERYSFLMRLDTPDRVAGGLAPFVALTGGIDAVDRLFATLEVVTPEDVQSAAARFLVPEHRTVAVLEGVKR